MSRRIAPVLLAFWLVLAPVAWAIDPVELPDPVLQERYRVTAQASGRETTGCTFKTR